MAPPVRLRYLILTLPPADTLAHAMMIPPGRSIAGETYTAPVLITFATATFTSSSPFAGTEPTSMVTVFFSKAVFTVPSKPNLKVPFSSSINSRS